MKVREPVRNPIQSLVHEPTESGSGVAAPPPSPSTSQLLIEGGTDALLIEGGLDALLLQA